MTPNVVMMAIAIITLLAVGATARRYHNVSLRTLLVYLMAPAITVWATGAMERGFGSCWLTSAESWDENFGRYLGMLVWSSIAGDREMVRRGREIREQRRRQQEVREHRPRPASHSAKPRCRCRPSTTSAPPRAPENTTTPTSSRSSGRWLDSPLCNARVETAQRPGSG